MYRDSWDISSQGPTAANSALAASHCLIVVCSPAAAGNHYVNEAVRWAFDQGPKLVVVKDGPRGAWAGDGKQTVGQLVKAQGAVVNGFVLYVVGEGIEKKKDDFAAEVAAMAKT